MSLKYNQRFDYSTSFVTLHLLQRKPLHPNLIRRKLRRQGKHFFLQVFHVDSVLVAFDFGHEAGLVKSIVLPVSFHRNQFSLNAFRCFHPNQINS